MGLGAARPSWSHSFRRSPRRFLASQLRLRALGLLCLTAGIAWSVWGPSRGDGGEVESAQDSHDAPPMVAQGSP